MSFLIRTRQNRTQGYTVGLLEADLVTQVLLSATDVVRFKVGANGETPAIDLSSIEPSEHGSTLTFTPGTNTVTVTLAQGDVRTRSGAFDAEILVVDDSVNLPSDANPEEKAIKHAESGVLFVHPSQGGEIAEEQSSSSQSNSESSESSSENSSSSSSS